MRQKRKDIFCKKNNDRQLIFNKKHQIRIVFQQQYTSEGIFRFVN